MMQIGARMQRWKKFGPADPFHVYWNAVDVRNRAFIERLLPLGALLVAIASVPYMAFSRDGLSRLQRLHEERDQMDAEIERLTRQIRSLRSQVREIKEDPAAVERVARDELGLVRKTEVVFQFTP